MSCPLCGVEEIESGLKDAVSDIRKLEEDKVEELSNIAMKIDELITTIKEATSILVQRMP
jgi:hypothetical protein